MASKALEYKQPFLLSSLRKSDCFLQWVEKVSEVSEVSEVLTKKALVSMITPFWSMYKHKRSFLRLDKKDWCFVVNVLKKGDQIIGISCETINA